MHIVSTIISVYVFIVEKLSDAYLPFLNYSNILLSEGEVGSKGMSINVRLVSYETPITYPVARGGGKCLFCVHRTKSLEDDVTPLDLLVDDESWRDPVAVGKTFTMSQRALYRGVGTLVW